MEALPNSQDPPPDDLGEPQGSPTSVRKGRYSRSSTGKTPTLTPQKLGLLGYLGECRLLSLPQLARLCCPSEQSARRHLRELFDAGLIDVIAVARAALSPPGSANDASLIYGSAPNVYTLTRAGMEVLVELGRLERQALRRPPPAFGPKNGLFLAHELAVRDVFVWAELDAAAHPRRRVLNWVDGTEARIALPSGAARPDACLVYQIGWHRLKEQEDAVPLVLVGLVEIDRGTERGITRWAEKLTDYFALFSNREALRSRTGYNNARVLVFTPDEKRRDTIADLLTTQIQERGLSPALYDHFWLTDHSFLLNGTLGLPAWRIPGEAMLQPLLSAEFLQSQSEPKPQSETAETESSTPNI